MSTSSSGSAGNDVGGESIEVPTSLGSMSEIQQQLSTLSRQTGQLASRLTDSEGQRAEETANAVAMQAAQRAEEEQRKGREVPRVEYSDVIPSRCPEKSRREVS